MTNLDKLVLLFYCDGLEMFQKGGNLRQTLSFLTLPVQSEHHQYFLEDYHYNKGSKYSNKIIFGGLLNEDFYYDSSFVLLFQLNTFFVIVGSVDRFFDLDYMMFKFFCLFLFYIFDSKGISFELLLGLLSGYYIFKQLLKFQISTFSTFFKHCKSNEHFPG